MNSYFELFSVATVCILTGISWRYVHSFFKRCTAKLLYGSTTTPVEKIRALENDFQHSTRYALEKLGNLLNLPSGKLRLITNKVDDPTYSQFLSQQKSVLIVDEIENAIQFTDSKANEQLKELKMKMRSDETALILPLYDENSGISHLLVSPHKIDGGLFSREEVRALQKVIDKVQGYINADRKVSQSQALANTIAHEMRNPLTQAQLQFEELKEMVKNRAPTPDILSDIEKGSAAIQRGRQLIDIILREVSDSSLTKEPAVDYSIRKVIEQAINRYGFESSSIQQRVIFGKSPDFVAKLNDTLFHFVLFNLLRNAIYYFDSYPDSQIHISTKQGEHENCVVFRDNGPGIDPNVLPKVFEDFFTHDKNGGSGLGLGYCQRVMQAFGGRITCESELGSFTEFKLYLPVVTNSSVTLNDNNNLDRSNSIEGSFASTTLSTFDENQQSVLEVDFSSKTILVVDDKEVQRALVKLYLEQLGCKVIQANNGLTAVSVFRSNPVDVVLMDIQMPVMNGFQACEQIHEISPTTPVIALSGECGVEDLAKIQQVMNARLEKPTSKIALEEMLVDLFSQSAKQTVPVTSGTDYA
nr:hybrid sensor histidine kinase/response regulator [Vibrio marisflavi]